MDIQFFTRDTGVGPHSLKEVYVKVIYGFCGAQKLPH